MKNEISVPYPGEIDEAKRIPNGWVYRIAGRFGPNDRVPPEAIVGKWIPKAISSAVSLLRSS
jgi:hypothetical protein